VAPFVNRDEVLLAEAMSAPRALETSFAGGNFRGVLPYTWTEGHWRTHLLWSEARSVLPSSLRAFSFLFASLSYTSLL